MRFGLFRRCEVQAELGVLQQQLGSAFNSCGLISEIDQIAVRFDKFTRLLQCAMQTARAAQHGSNGFEHLVVLGGSFGGVFRFVEFVQPSGVGGEMILQGKTAAVFHAGLPNSIRLPPKQRRPPGDIMRAGHFVQDDQQVPDLEHGALGSWFAAHPIANGLGNGGPKIGDDLDVWFHGWDWVSIPPP